MHAAAGIDEVQIECGIVEIRVAEIDGAVERELRCVLDRQVQRERDVALAADREILQRVFVTLADRRGAQEIEQIRAAAIALRGKLEHRLAEIRDRRRRAGHAVALHARRIRLRPACCR